ncbi:alanine racemase [bacterium]|nr:alanine racemase [bacterium]
MNRATWIEISRSSLLNNYRIFKELAGPVELLPVLKSNAYGHGMAAVSGLLVKAGQRWFGVHTAEEAIALRDVNLNCELRTLILSWVPPELLPELLETGARFTVIDMESLEELEAGGRRQGTQVPIHLKVETGVNRQGFSENQLDALVKKLRACEHLHVEGVHSHFANIEDSTDHSYALQQMRRFESAVSRLRAGGVEPKMIHQSCSAAGILFPETRGDLLRVGISLYGHWPSRETLVSARAEGRNKLNLKPVMSWKARIIQVKDVPAGSYVGYGCSWKAEAPTRLGVLPVGYADGYDRGLGGAWVLVKGKRAPVRGRIMMNLSLVDLSHIPEAGRGDEAVLIGSQNGEEISAETLAGLAGTINYEILARVAAHVHRQVAD